MATRAIGGASPLALRPAIGGGSLGGGVQTGGGSSSAYATTAGVNVGTPTRFLQNQQQAQQAAAAPSAPAMPNFSMTAGGGGAAAAGPAGPSAPPEIKDLQITAETDPRLTNYANKYESHLGDIKAGTTREADVMRGQLDSDAERQIASAKESALAAGRPWTAQDESRMRSELSRGKYGAMAEFELGSQRQATEAMQGGLGIEKAPFESQLAEKGFSQGTQKMLMDYALGRGGLVSEDKKTAVMQAGQSIDAYKAFLSMLGGGSSFDFGSSFA